MTPRLIYVKQWGLNRHQFKDGNQKKRQREMRLSDSVASAENKSALTTWGSSMCHVDQALLGVSLIRAPRAGEGRTNESVSS